MSRNAHFDAEMQNLRNILENSHGFYDKFHNHKRELLERSLDIADDMQRTYETKDSDYSENGLPMGNLRSSEEFGVPAWRGVMIRMGDKKRRVGTFAERGKYVVNDEKLADTLVDLATYSILGLLLFTEEYSDEKIKDCFRAVACQAIKCKILYEYATEIPELNENSWKSEDYQCMLRNYQEIAKFARETSGK